MLIKALADYYDLLEKSGRLPSRPGWSNEKISYLVCLTPEGDIDDIVDIRAQETNSKGKTIYSAREFAYPKRDKTTSVVSHLIDTRPEYIFGIEYKDDGCSVCQKKWDKFKEKHSDFFAGADDALCAAFLLYLEKWIPQQQTENPLFLKLAKNLNGAGYGFCLSGFPNEMLNNNRFVVDKWEDMLANQTKSEDDVYGQCAVSGKYTKIARIHDNLKGVAGGQASGVSIVSYNKPAFESYGKEQSFISNLSEEIMQKYTAAFNILTANRNHSRLVDDMTVIFWADCEDDEKISDAFSLDMFGSSKAAGEQTENMLESKLKLLSEGIAVTADGEAVSSNSNFYIFGVVPNASRLCIKFIYRSKFGDIMKNVYRHQQDISVNKNMRPVALWRLTEQLKSPKSTNAKVSSSLSTDIFKSILLGTNYPNALQYEIIQRVKTDSDTDKNRFIKLNDVRAGIIKACINRKQRLNNKKEEITLSLDPNNTNEAYLCGRLFAILEVVQQNALGNLNKTIKDGYFSSACSTPAAVFPRLMQLGSYHLSKLEQRQRIYYNKQIGEIISKLPTSFPKTLNLDDQGRFILGYYQQTQSIYTKKDDTTENTSENEND